MLHKKDKEICKSVRYAKPNKVATHAFALRNHSCKYTRGFLKFITFSTDFDFDYHVEEEYNTFIAHINCYCI